VGQVQQGVFFDWIRGHSPFRQSQRGRLVTETHISQREIANGEKFSGCSLRKTSSSLRVCYPLLSHMGRNNLFNERLEALVAAEIIKHWIGSNLSNVGVALAIRSFHLVNRALLIAQGEIH
jgi:hypothetical protein